MEGVRVIELACELGESRRAVRCQRPLVPRERRTHPDPDLVAWESFYFRVEEWVTWGELETELHGLVHPDPTIGRRTPHASPQLVSKPVSSEEVRNS